MSKSGRWALAEQERAFLNGDLNNAVDPYHHDVALVALRRIAAGEVDAAAIARRALGTIEDRKEA